MHMHTDDATGSRDQAAVMSHVAQHKFLFLLPTEIID